MNTSQNIYDRQEFFEGYQRLRENPCSANNVEEKPALFSLAPELTEKRVLDLGCGFGKIAGPSRRWGQAMFWGSISRKRC